MSDPSDPSRRGRGGRRLRVAVAVAVAGALGVGGVAVVVRSRETRPPPKIAVGGVRMGATGIVVAQPGQPVKFCPELGPARLPERPPTECFGGVLADGVDLRALADRRETSGIVWGDAYLAGPFRDGTLYVDEQTPPRPRTGRYEETKVPCREPAGGWPVHPPKKGFPGEYEEPSTTQATHYRFRHPGEITHEVGVQVRPRSVVIIVWAMRPKVVERALRPVYGGSLCVVRSRYDRRTIVAARNAVGRLVGTYGVSSAGGPDIGSDGQPVVSIGYGVPRPEIDRALAKFPPDLVTRRQWLKPVA